MRNTNAYTLIYAAGICLVSSLLLSVTASGLKAQQDRMSESDRKFNVLKALQAEVLRPDGARIGVEAIETMFREHVAEVRYDEKTGEVLGSEGGVSGAGLPVFQWTDGGRVTRYAIPVSGAGLWGPIYGYLALNRELDTVIGVTFYRHAETPGLGGEIEKDAFTKPFTGQKVFADGALRPVEVVKGRVADRYPAGAPCVAVDGISGATITGRGISQFMTDDLKSYERIFSVLRKP
jgi:Na+-transporting NADH:ubiquinone oxidoreductase subunit C